MSIHKNATLAAAAVQATATAPENPKPSVEASACGEGAKKGIAQRSDGCGAPTHAAVQHVRQAGGTRRTAGGLQQRTSQPGREWGFNASAWRRAQRTSFGVFARQSQASWIRGWVGGEEGEGGEHSVQ